jgi:hypothetical protein
MNADHKIENLKGPVTSAVKDFLDKKGLAYKIETMVWGRAYNLAKLEKNILIYPLSRTKERETTFQWIKEISKQEYNLIGRSSISPNTLSREEILGGDYYAICEIRSAICNITREFGFPENRIIRIAGTYIKAMISRVINGRATFFVENFEDIKKVLKDNPELMRKIEKVDGFEISYPEYLAAKNLDPEILAKLTTKN